jgi:gas vesicle protein
MRDSNKAIWFLTGAAFGAGIALLFAPQSGEETRTYLRSQARRGRDKVAEAGREVAEKGRRLFETGLELADEADDVFRS